jgi:hypothetical protein
MIYSSLDEYDRGAPAVRTLWGHDISIESAKDDLQKLEDRIDAYVGELEKRMDSASRRRLRSKLEALERELDFLFRQVYPPAPNGDDGFENVRNNDAVVSCRASNCSNQLTKSLGFRTLGFCPPHFMEATQTSTERA